MAASRHPVTEIPASVRMPDCSAIANVSMEIAPKRQLAASAIATNKIPSPASAVSFFHACKVFLSVFTAFKNALIFALDHLVVKIIYFRKD